MRTQKIIVSMTTTSYRIDFAYLVIKNLLEGYLIPDKIILYISKEPYLYDKGIKELPEKFYNFGDKLEIKWVTNTGPHRKYIHTFSEYKNDIVILLDDDIYKDSLFIRNIINVHEKNPECVIGSIGSYTSKNIIKGRTYFLPTKKIAKNNKNNDIIMFWCGWGTLFNMSMFSSKEIEILCDEKAILRLSPTSSEIWLNSFIWEKRIPIIIEDSFVEHLDKSQDMFTLRKLHRNTRVKMINLFFCSNYFGKILK